MDRPANGQTGKQKEDANLVCPATQAGKHATKERPHCARETSERWRAHPAQETHEDKELFIVS
jgi:hypothetical protein